MRILNHRLDGIARRQVEAAPPPRVGSSHDEAVEEAIVPVVRRTRFRALFENKVAVVGLAVIVGLVLFAYVGPLIYHTDQTGTFLARANQPPSAHFPLGTGPEGRDLLGSLMAGGRSSIEIGFGVAALATLFGMAWGAISGYVGGVVDAVMMRIVDALMSIPILFFIVLLAAIIHPTLLVIFLILSAGSWMAAARLVRGEVLSLRERQYISASWLFGGKSLHILIRHIMPNVLGVVLVAGTFAVADAILAFAGMTFLGFGLPPPATSWGELLTVGVGNVFDGYWWQLWPPAIALVLVVLAVNVAGDGLRDVVEQRFVRR